MSAIPVGPIPRQTRVPQATGPRRQSVEVAPTRAQRRARPRLLVALATVGGLFGILAAQLLLTIATSEGAYQIAALQAQEVELGRDEQILTEQLRVLGAPQHLAAEAQAMGMVPSSTAAYLRLSDGAVLGTPAPASASAALRTADDGTALIPDALLTTVPLVGAGAMQDAATAEAATDAAAAAAAAAVGGETASTEGGAPTSATVDPSVASEAPAVIPTPNTH